MSSQLVCDILSSTFVPCSCVGNASQHNFCCSESTKQIDLKIAKPSGDLPLTAETIDFSKLQQYLMGLASRVHEGNSFHLTISSNDQKVTILCFDPEIITHPKTYHSFVATRCFVDWNELPSPDHLPPNHFQIMGVVSDDYCSTLRVSKAMAKVAAGQNDYKVVHDALAEFTEHWKSPTVVNVRQQKRLKSERNPRKRRIQRYRLRERRRQVALLPQQVRRNEIPFSPLVLPSRPSTPTPLPPPPPTFASRIPLLTNSVSPIRISRKRGSKVVTPLRGIWKRQRISTPTPSPGSPPRRSISPLASLSRAAGPTNHSNPASDIDMSDSEDPLERQSPPPPPHAMEEAPVGIFPRDVICLTL